MKAYHLSKAREPSDLPSWLFTNQERRAVDTAMSAAEVHDRDSPPPPVDAQVPKRRAGLRDIYDSTPVSENVNLSSSRTRKDLPDAPSKATDRLRALRDAKRSATTAGSSVYERGSGDHHEEYRDNVKTDGISHSVNTSVRSRSQRVGLPARPGTARRP